MERSRDFYEAAVFGGDPGALAAADAELDAVDAPLCLARGRIAHARFLEERREDPRELELFERAAALFRRLGDVAGEAESLFWVGAFHQVVRGDDESALPALRRSAELARSVGGDLTLSYALRHLAFAADASGDKPQARRFLQASTELRRELGFMPGVAANLIGQAYQAHEDGRRQEAAALLDEAASIAAAGAARGVERWVVQARTALALDGTANAPADGVPGAAG